MSHKPEVPGLASASMLISPIFAGGAVFFESAFLTVVSVLFALLFIDVMVERARKDISETISKIYDKPTS